MLCINCFDCGMKERQTDRRFAWCFILTFHVVTLQISKAPTSPPSSALSTDWLTDWLTGWLGGRLANCLIAWLCRFEYLVFDHLMLNKGQSLPYNRRWMPRGGVEVYLYSFFNLVARWWVVNATPRPLYPRGNRLSTCCIGGWAGPRVSVDRCGKSLHHRDSILGGPSSLVLYKQYSNFGIRRSVQVFLQVCLWILTVVCLYPLSVFLLKILDAFPV
jgi:hypothetical protein